MEHAISDSHPGVWIVWGPSWPLAVRSGLFAALQAAFEYSMASTSWLDAPSRLALASSSAHLDAHAIMERWRAYGWAPPAA